jgi:hypothetical protein
MKSLVVEIMEGEVVRGHQIAVAETPWTPRA